MLFPYDTQAELTPSAVKIQRENLKQFELANFDKIAIDQLIANRTVFTINSFYTCGAIFNLPTIPH